MPLASDETLIALSEALPMSLLRCQAVGKATARLPLHSRVEAGDTKFSIGVGSEDVHLPDSLRVRARRDFIRQGVGAYAGQVVFDIAIGEQFGIPGKAAVEAGGKDLMGCECGCLCRLIYLQDRNRCIAV